MEERPGKQPYSADELKRNWTVAPEPRPLWEVGRSTIPTIHKYREIDGGT